MNESLSRKPKDSRNFQTRFIIITIIIFFSLFIILFNALLIQVIRNPEFSQKSSSTREKHIYIPPIRGKIITSDGKEVANNRTIFNLYIDNNVLEKNISKRQKVLLLLSKIINFDYNDIENIIKSKVNTKEEILIAENIKFSTVQIIKEYTDQLPGVIIKESLIREYPYNETLSHVLGFIGPIDPNELALKKNLGYKQFDLIGKSGIEKVYEDELRGKEGRKVYAINAKMVILEEIEEKEIKPEPGNEVILSIDLEFQKNIEDILADRTGAILAIRPSNGEIIGMASYPRFDPNIYILLTDENNEKKRLIDLDTKGTPLINRTLQAVYPSASIFKLVTTTAILNENLISPEKQFYCGGVYRLNNQEFGCWIRPGSHGWLNLEGGIANSCNIYFFNASLIVGIDKISQYAKMYGFGKITGIDLPSEKAGIIPSVQWKKEQGQTWFQGDTLNTVIGQGDVKVTLLQLANLLSVICNKGYSFKPHIVKEIRSPIDGSLIRKIEPEKHIEIKNVDTKTFDIIEKYLRTVVTSGTAKWAFWGNPLKFVGKTGTGEMSKTPTTRETCSLFAGYGPIDYPVEDRIVVVVLVENDNNEYLKYAARLANMVFHSWFTKENFTQTAKKYGFPIKESYR
ncbi:MAG TPA: penicillin-binding protein 2 [Spirochaetota bacterium]|nr:penicillin-binding protein 2 [Spirochaetota bacterium]